jgi:alpha-1,6-mannosyltransferase
MWAMKVVSALCVLGVASLVARVATVRGISAAPAAAFVALNPLVLVDVVGGAHNDGLMMLALVAGAMLVLFGRDATGGVAMAAAAAIKLPAAVAAPFAVLGTRDPRRGRLLLGLVAGILAVAGIAFAVFGTAVVHGLDFLSGSQERVSYHSLPATAARGLGVDVDAMRAAFGGAYAVLAVWLLVWTARGGDWVRAAAWAMFGLLCATVYLVPWYLLWVLPLVAVARDRALAVLTLALCAYQLQVGVP